MSRTFIACVSLLALTLAGPAHAAKGKGGKGKKKDSRELSMDAGTIQLGGQGTLQINSGGGNTQAGVSLSPSGGYFVIDGLEILAEVGVSSFGGATSASVAAGGRYHIDLDDPWIYVGATAGYGNISVGGVGADAILLSGQAGFLYPLSKNVGLDLGPRINVFLPSGGGSFINIPLGYLGVQSYFK